MPIIRSLCIILAWIVFASATPAFAQDVDGAADHPAISRYPGSQIKWYDKQAFEPYAIAVGPVTGYRKIDDWLETQGSTTRLYYELEGTKTHTEVYANYKKALEDQGFTILAQNVFSKSSQANDIGSRKWLTVHYARNTIPPAGIRLLSGSSTSGGSGFIAATKERAAGELYIAIAITQYSKDIIATMIDVVEVDSVETGLVSIDAEAIGSAIDEYGRIVLDGLYFAHDKATLTASSQDALSEISKFLKARPTMNFYVVGHTDAVGSYSYNRTLSDSRARAVVAALIADFGISAERLEGIGIGPLSPVFSNSSDGGRSKNRRVELVERP